MIFINCQIEEHQRAFTKRQEVAKYLCSKVKEATGLEVNMLESTCRQCMGQPEAVEKLIIHYLKKGILLFRDQGDPMGVPMIDLARKLQEKCGDQAVKDQLLRAVHLGRGLSKIVATAEELNLK